jgi:hypothetical protein
MTPQQFFDATRRAKFNSLMLQYGKLHDAGEGDEDHALELLAEALPLCPPEFKVKLDEIIEDIWGPMPKAEYCDDAGNPLYSVAQLEKWLGEKIDPKNLARVQKNNPMPGTVHRIH